MTAAQRLDQVQLISLDAIEADPHNPRKDFPKAAMAELAHSIIEHGVLSPILVRKVGEKFRVIAGERRWRAARMADHEQVPAIVSDVTDLEASEIQLDENLKRLDLAPLEVAGGYRRQLDLGRTMDEVCERAGKKRSAVYATLQLLQLGAAGRKALGEEKITPSVAQLVARVPKSLQEKALALVEGGQHQEPLSYREAESELQNAFTVDLRAVSFDTKDEKLTAAGSCVVCPKRSGNAKDLFPDLKNGELCTDPPCCRAKQLADTKRQVEAKGYKLLTDKDAPPEEVFWAEGRGQLREESGFVDPKAGCYDDTESRKYVDLLTEEQKKKLVVVVVDADGKPHQLLQRAGLTRELKKGGLFKERKKSTPATSKGSAQKPAEYKPPEPTLEELQGRAAMAALVEKVEKKGLTPALLRAMARELAGSFNGNQLYERRGVKDLGYGTPSDKEFEKAFGKASTATLVGLLFEFIFNERAEQGDSFDDVAELLGVDLKKVAAEVVAVENAKTALKATGALVTPKAIKQLVDVKTPAKKPAPAKKGGAK